MVSNIFVGILCVFVVVIAVIAWWVDNGGKK